MLKRFNIKNFLSFDAREDGKAEEFSMIAGKVRSNKGHLYDDGKVKLLKFAAVFGANAAGKSNLVKAMDFMRGTIVFGLPKGHTELYCKSDLKNKEKPSYFEVEILLNGHYYTYGYEIILSQSRFISEWLFELHADNSEKRIFERDIESKKIHLGSIFKDKKLAETMEVYTSDIKDDSTVLFLTVMNRNKKNFYLKFEKAHILKDVFDWIKHSLDINFPDVPISDYSYLSRADNVKEVCKVISAFGTGITDYKMIDVQLEQVLETLPKNLRDRITGDIERKQVEHRQNNDNEKSIMVMRSKFDFFAITVSKDEKVKCQTIEFSHGKDGILFELSEESDGTLRILDLLEVLLSKEGKTYVIDELDRCLHPSLTYKFVETFFKVAREKNIQLIVTTHESRLLDFDLLRRDEIWFVNKRNGGETDIYSLEEYNTRFDQKIDKAYLEGRYGGVPLFTTVFPVKAEGDSK